MFFSSRALLNTSLCGGLSLMALTPAGTVNVPDQANT